MSDSSQPLLTWPGNKHELSQDVLSCYDEREVLRTIETLQFSIGYQICGHAYLGPDKKLKVCTSVAGRNTAHPNRGRCFRHDGMLLEAELSSYTSQLIQYPTLQALYEEFRTRG